MPENEKLPPPVNLKHRIIGAVILVSLAVIFLPMIFSEREPPVELRAISEIPDKAPASDAVPAPAPSAAGYELPAPVPEDSRDRAGATSGKKEVERRQEHADEAATTVPAKMPVPAASEDAPAVTPPAVGKPAKGWVVQIGIFANAANATRLADKLKTQGYDVTLESVVLNNEKRQRLRVGPFADKAVAQQAQVAIQKVYGVAGAVLPYP